LPCHGAAHHALYVGRNGALVGYVDVLGPAHLDVAGDVVAPAKVEHLLSLLDPANEAPREHLHPIADFRPFYRFKKQ